MVGAVNTLVHPVSSLHPTILLSSSLALPSASPIQVASTAPHGSIGRTSDNSSLRCIDVTEARGRVVTTRLRAVNLSTQHAHVVGTHLDSTHTPALNACKTSRPARDVKTLMTAGIFCKWSSKGSGPTRTQRDRKEKKKPLINLSRQRNKRKRHT